MAPRLLVAFDRRRIMLARRNGAGRQVMSTIPEWLTSLGMPEYAERFAENDIDTSVLRHLTDQDLKELGVSLGHRRKMLAAIAELGGAVPTPALSLESSSTDTRAGVSFPDHPCDRIRPWWPSLRTPPAKHANGKGTPWAHVH
jgi:hypothetical protein